MLLALADLAWHAEDMRCPHCKGKCIHRSRRRELERLLSIFGLYPYRCDDCGRRFLRVGARPS